MLRGTALGSFTRFYLRHIGSVDWNRPSEYGERYMNMLVANCDPWTKKCGEVAEILLEQGANVNATSANKLGLAPIHSALGIRTALLFLLDHGASPNQTATGDRFKGLTAIQVAETFRDRPTEAFNCWHPKADT